MATITFEKVTKAYAGGAPAVASLDLAVADGEFLVLVGPSGCGKTTALRMIAGLEDITAGRLLIGGRLANDASPRERDIAMVFQSYALYPHLSVRANIGFGLAVRGVGTAEVARKVAEVAALLELGDYLDRRPAHLSGGQRQRVAMGRALVRSPSAFLMDEPLSNLDARLRGQMRAEIAGLQKRTGVTTVYVTHDQVEAMTMGHRVAVMSRGVLQQLDTPRALYDRPANLFVAGFIGAPGMNFIAGAVRRMADGTVLMLGEHGFPLQPAVAPDLAQGTQRRVIAGLRPEVFRPAGEGEEGALPGRVAFVEDLGATLLAHVALEGARVTSAVDDGSDAFAASHLTLRATLPPGQAVRPGDAIRLVPDLGRLHLFDPAGGTAIGPRGLRSASKLQ